MGWDKQQKIEELLSELFFSSKCDEMHSDYMNV